MQTQPASEGLRYECLFFKKLFALSNITWPHCAQKYLFKILVEHGFQISFDILGATSSPGLFYFI